MKTTTHLKLLPYLFYENPAAAIDWLSNAFGFTERFRLSMPNGVVAHAELELGQGVVMAATAKLRTSSISGAPS